MIHGYGENLNQFVFLVNLSSDLYPESCLRLRLSTLLHLLTVANLGLTWKEAKERCPEGVVPACHNAEDTVTVSGPAQAVHDFVVQLQEEGYFAREVSSNGVAFHSYYMASIAPKLKECLSKVRCFLELIVSVAAHVFR